MLPTLTFKARAGAFPSRRAVVAFLGTILLVASVAGSLIGTGNQTSGPTPPLSLAQRLSAATWALTVPVDWLATPLPQIETGDSVDLLGVRTGERPLATVVAADLRALRVDDRAITFEVDEESATGIATAHAAGFVIVPLLRSTR